MFDILKLQKSTESKVDVFVVFTVDMDGSITGVKIVSGVDKHLDMEAFRVVR